MATGRAVYCSNVCRQRAWRATRASLDAGALEYDLCRHCLGEFEWVRSRAGQVRFYCSPACSQAFYRKQKREEAERQEQWERDERARRAREEREERARSKSAGGGDSSGAYHRGGLGVTEARAIVFRLAGFNDDGRTRLRAAYRRAAKILHPDVNPGGEQDFKLLERAMSVLHAAGHL